MKDGMDTSQRASGANRKLKWHEKPYVRSGYAQIAGKSQYGEAYSPLGTLATGHGEHGIDEISK